MTKPRRGVCAGVSREQQIIVVTDNRFRRYHNTPAIEAGQGKDNYDKKIIYV